MRKEKSEMLFHEIYGSYYNVIAAVLSEAVNGTLEDRKIRKIIQEKAFDESILNIPDKLVGGNWHLLTEDYETPLMSEPKIHLTMLQKRWLKSLLLDPRIKLFQPDDDGLKDLEPLFSPEMVVYYDQNRDGDPYTEPIYVENFRSVLEAIHSGQWIDISYETARGKKAHYICHPKSIEYSQKDDKFRVRISLDLDRPETDRVLNISRIIACNEIMDDRDMESCRDKSNPKLLSAGIQKRSLTLEVTDERNGLERILFHFSHLEKETKKLDSQIYRLKLVYDASDEMEMLIRILSFGPKIKVIEPEDFIVKIRERLLKQQTTLTEK